MRKALKDFESDNSVQESRLIDREIDLENRLEEFQREKRKIKKLVAKLNRIVENL